MNNSVALLYNFNEEKLKMIKMVCMMMQVGIILVLAVYGLIYISFRKNKKKWWMAAGASEEYLQERGYIE